MTEHLLSLGGHATRVLDEGSGPPVVLVHATPFDLDYWAGLALRLRGENRVLRYDLAGHGSARGAPVPATERLAADLVELLDARGIPDAHLVGHSLGGAVVLRVALDRPERVTRLSLLGTRAAPTPALAALARALREDSAAVGAPMHRWFLPSALAANGSAVRYARRMVDGVDVAAWADGLDRIAVFDVVDELPRLTMPLDVVVGDDDHTTKPEHGRAIAAAVPGAHFHLVPGARALLALEDPGVVADLLRDGC